MIAVLCQLGGAALILAFPIAIVSTAIITLAWLASLAPQAPGEPTSTTAYKPR